MPSATAFKHITVRIEDSLKIQATEILDSIGLEFNDYLNLAVRQLVNQRRIPFELKAADEVAYVRFASVYRQFKDINTFMDELAKLLGEKNN